jgi:hypothetical protein
MHATDNITIWIKQCVWKPVVLLYCHSGLQLSGVSLLNLLWHIMFVTPAWALTYIHLENLNVDVDILLKWILKNMPYVTICNMLNFYIEELSALPSPQVGGSPLVGWLWLLIATLHIRRLFPPLAISEHAMPRWPRTYLTQILNITWSIQLTTHLHLQTRKACRPKRDAVTMVRVFRLCTHTKYHWSH